MADRFERAQVASAWWRMAALSAGSAVALLACGSGGETGGNASEAPSTSVSATSADVPQTTVTTPADDIPTDEGIDDCDRRVAADSDVRLVYEPDRTMTVGETYGVIAAVTVDGSVDVTFASPTTVVPVRNARCQVEAELSGPDFEVDPPAARAQSLVGRTGIAWRWQVRPRREGGDLQLTLRIQGQLVEDGLVLPGPEDTTSATIDVSAEPVSLADRIGSAVSAETVGTGVALATAVASAGAWARRRTQARRRPEPRQPEAIR
jgi:hypothetical protein